LDEEPLFEIVNGQRVELPPMSIYAGLIASRLHVRLGVHVEDHALGTAVCEVLFILDPEKDLRRRPDVAFVSAERWPLTREVAAVGDWAVVPDLAVEVVSPTDEFADVLAKVREYFKYGVRHVWVIVPEEQQVYVYDSAKQVRILTAGELLRADHLLPGFALPVASLFGRIPQTKQGPDRGRP
jgi:Uma2 family endonuclease